MWFIEATIERDRDSDKRGLMAAWLCEFFARQKRLEPISHYDGLFFSTAEERHEAAVEARAANAAAHFEALRRKGNSKVKVEWLKK